MTEKSKNCLCFVLMMTSLWGTGTKYKFFLYWNVRYKVLFLDWKFHVKLLTTTEVIYENMFGRDQNRGKPFLKPE